MCNQQRGVELPIYMFDSEIRVMNILWREGDMSAKQISSILEREIGWKMNTSYTVIKKCIQKGYVERKHPNFICHAIVLKETVQRYATEKLVADWFDSSYIELISFLLREDIVDEKEISHFLESRYERPLSNDNGA